MALTAEDMQGLREMVEDVITRRVDPRFEAVDQRFDAIDQRFDRMQSQLDVLRLGYEPMHLDIKVLRENSTAITELVKDHTIEIARLKHRPA